MEFKQPTVDDILNDVEDQEQDPEQTQDQDEYQEYENQEQNPVENIEQGNQTDFEYESNRQSESNYLNPVLQFHISFTGDLDLEFLSKGQKTGVLKELYFHTPGKIRSLKNLPDTLEILYCPNQKLIEIEPLPTNLKTLHVPKNQLESLNLAKTPQLKILNVSDNKLYSISHLTPSLEEINIQNNPKLEILDFEDNDFSNTLKVFEHDPKLILKNFDYEAFQKQQGGAKKNKDPESSSPPFQPSSPPTISFQDAIYKYFEYKREYEKNTEKLKLDMRKSTKKSGKETKKPRNKPELPKCIKCKKPVGMTFKKDGYYYIAKCGLNNKYNCDFHLEIKAPEMVDFIKEVDDVYQEFEKDKEELIRLKMDNLFGYETNDITTKRFEKKMKDYKISNQFLHDLLEKYQDLFGKNVTKEYQLTNMESEIQQLNEEYKDMLDAHREDPTNYILLDNAMEFYVTKIRPKHVEWMRLNYPTMEMNTVFYQREYKFAGKNDSTFPGKLYYSHITPEFYAYEYEKSYVVKFNE